LLDCVLISIERVYLHHRRPSYRPSTWRNRHAPSCRRTWTCRCRGKRS
jgi:hypothetical protein